MIRLNPDQQRQPYGGHRFPEGDLIVTGETFDEVVSKVRQNRIVNGRPLGNPKVDVLRYYAEKWPYMVLVDDKPQPMDDLTAMFQRYRAWLHGAWRNPPKRLVSLKEASMRWDICLKCPHNTKPDWKETGESAELARRSFLLRQGNEIPEELGFCALHKWDNGVAVFIKDAQEFSAVKDTEEARCWMKGSLMG